MNLHDKAVKIKALILDVDGVLTDGCYGYYGQDDGKEIKFFHARDGHGLKMLMRAGIKVGLLTGRTAAANRYRAKELGMDFVYEKCLDKKSAFLQMLAEQNLKAEECCYVGDDVVDLPPLRMAGLAVAVHDGVKELDPFVDFRTEACGGHGAVREVVDFLLHEQGKYEEVTRRYFED